VISAPAAGDTDSRTDLQHACRRRRLDRAPSRTRGLGITTTRRLRSSRHGKDPSCTSRITSRASQRIERVHRLVVRWWRTAIGRQLPQTGGTLAETPPERWGLSVVGERRSASTTEYRANRDPVPGADIVAIWQPGDTEHAEHVRTSPCRKPADLPLQPSSAVVTHDCFERSDGQWRFVESA